MRFRSYLEGLEDLTLPKLRHILRSHYQENSATELYRQLSTLVPKPQESPQSFLIRALDTRQKLLFASQEVDTQLQYGSKLVQGMFLLALDTGLQDKAARNWPRPFLQVPGVQDKALTQQINVIVSEEMERKSKLGMSSSHKSTKVYEVDASKTEGTVQQGMNNGKVTAGQKDSPRRDKFMVELQAVRSELATLKASVVKWEQLTRTSPGYTKQQWHQRPKGCPSS